VTTAWPAGAVSRAVQAAQPPVAAASRLHQLDHHERGLPQVLAESSESAVLASPEQVQGGLEAVSYLADAETASIVYLAGQLSKPLLIEGPAGTGKTQLAKSVSEMTGYPLVRLQCYEGLDESRAIYEWNYRKQLLRISAQQAAEDAPGQAWADVRDNIFSEEFLLERPLLAAIRAKQRVVLLIDEVDRLDVETEALLLEVLSEFQVTIPELGTVHATTIPLIFLTSNNFRELSEALKRRCLFLYMGYPDVDRERQIIQAKLPGLPASAAEQASRVVEGLRRLDLKKPPSVAETLDWAHSLLLAGVGEIGSHHVRAGLPVLLKHQADIAVAREHLDPAD
jgi:MoxR-like ATPase